MLEARTRTPHLIPTGSQGKMTCLFIVLIPMAAILTVASIWVYTAKYEWDLAVERSNHVRSQLLQIARLLIHLNSEREYSAIYTSARRLDSINNAHRLLYMARQKTDSSLLTLNEWPGSEENEGYMFKSNFIFSAILDTHRKDVENGDQFWEEIEYYSNLIDIIYGWFMDGIKNYKNQSKDLFQYFLSYSYLLGSINYLGTEQCLCTVFSSVICFTHKETFSYANYSFSGEAVFNLYRHSFPIDSKNDWIFRTHSDYFPELSNCRKEIIADIKYNGMSIDPSQCDYSRKNETIFHDIELLTIDENNDLVANILQILANDISSAKYSFILKTVILGGSVIYFLLVHVCRCSTIRCIQIKKKKKLKEKYVEMASESEKMEHYNSLNAQTPTIIGFEDYGDCNCTTNYIKVATV